MQENNLIQLFKTRTKNIGQRRWNCPDDAQIAAYADHKLVGPVRERLEAHLADCDFCLDQVASLVRIQNASLPESVPGDLLLRAMRLVEGKTKSVGISLWDWGKIAAATACLVVVGTIAFRNRLSSPVSVPVTHPVKSIAQAPPRVKPPTPMVTTPASTVRGGHKTLPEPTLVFPTNGSAVPENNIEFRWEAVVGSLDYEVKLLTAEGDSVWSQTSTASHLRLPSDVKLEMGKKYFVQVRANLSEGKSVQSAPVAFAVAEHK